MLNKNQYELIMKAFESHRRQNCFKDEKTRYKINKELQEIKEILKNLLTNNQ